MIDSRKLSSQEQQKLVASYIERYRDMYVWNNGMILNKNDLNFWAYEQLDDLAKHAPSIALDVILEILNCTDDENVLSCLAAGPLEDIIRFHGKLMISRIEHEAKRNKKFKDLLYDVWPVGSQETWECIHKLL
jgi:hypothetical protein